MAKTSETCSCFKTITFYHRIHCLSHLCARTETASLWKSGHHLKHALLKLSHQRWGWNCNSKPTTEILWEKTVRSYLCYFFKILMTFLQSPGPMERFPYTCVFAQKCFSMVLNPVQHLQSNTDTHAIKTMPALFRVKGYPLKTHFSYQNSVGCKKQRRKKTGSNQTLTCWELHLPSDLPSRLRVISSYFNKRKSAYVYVTCNNDSVKSHPSLHITEPSTLPGFCVGSRSLRHRGAL